jgi:hypothetical protein
MSGANADDQSFGLFEARAAEATRPHFTFAAIELLRNWAGQAVPAESRNIQYKHPQCAF